MHSLIHGTRTYTHANKLTHIRAWVRLNSYPSIHMRMFTHSWIHILWWANLCVCCAFYRLGSGGRCADWSHMRLSYALSWYENHEKKNFANTNRVLPNLLHFCLLNYWCLNVFSLMLLCDHTYFFPDCFFIKVFGKNVLVSHCFADGRLLLWSRSTLIGS